MQKKTGVAQYICGQTIKSDGNLHKEEYTMLDILDIKRCAAGSLIATIKANGEVLPCVFMEDTFKKFKMNSECIFEKTLKEIWDNGEQFKFQRNIDINDNCKNCDKYPQNCNGGCPAVLDKLGNDINSLTIYCPYNKY